MLKLQYNHTHHTSSNPKAAIEFYTKNLGAKVTKVMGSPDKPVYIIDLGGLIVEVTGSTRADEALKNKQAATVVMRPQYGLHHLAFTVDDLDAAVKDLKSKGVQFVVEAPPGETSYAFIMCPDDLLIQLNQAPKKSQI